MNPYIRALIAIYLAVGYDDGLSKLAEKTLVNDDPQQIFLAKELVEMNRKEISA